MKQIIKNNIKSLSKIIGTLTTIAIISRGIYSEFFSEKVKNSAHLLEIIEQEEKKIRRDDIERIIYITYGKTEWGTAGSAKIGNKAYIIILDGERNRNTIRHELYHIFAGHCDMAAEKGEWTFWDKLRDELAARIYANYGLKL